MTTGTSGKVLGHEYLNRMLAYLSTCESLPLSKDGSLNITAIAEQAGIPKQSIYKNPAIRQAMEETRVARGVHSWAEQRIQDGTRAASDEATPTPRAALSDSKRLQAAERRVTVLEQQNAVLTAENYELRRQLKDFKQRLGRQDMMIETGRRVPSPNTVKND